MDNEINKLQWAKRYIDYLANGVDPINNTDADGDTLHNEEVKSCLRYVSDVLARDICEVGTNIKKSRAFYITDDQAAQLQTYSYNCKVSELATEINRVTEENDRRELPATWINDWLESEGYLCKSDLNCRAATEKGQQLGITSEYRKRDDGNEYYINLFAEQAQLFVFTHLDDIISYRDKIKPLSEVIVQVIEYPDEINVKDFIRQNNDKCFIMSIGSYDSVVGEGSYISVLHYRGKSKVLKKTNITANSAKQCILTGIIDAASAIKSPTDVIILSSSPLGFNTSKRRTYNYCRKIYQILTEKDCKIFVAVCQGKASELNNFVRALN